MTPTEIYDEARAAHDRACTLYREATESYGAGDIDDATYLKARTAREAADKVFDAAFAARQDEPEPEEIAPETDDGQLDLSV